MKQSVNVYKTKNLLNQDVIVQVQYGSTNSKTGDGVQIWILPYEWILLGKSAMDSDEASCLDCPHSKRGSRKCLRSWLSPRWYSRLRLIP